MTARTDVSRSLPDRQHLGAQIRDARNQLGMNQREFATIAGFRQCSVSYIENATRDVLASTLVDAAATVGLVVALVREYHLPLLDLPADEVDALHEAAAQWWAAGHTTPALDAALTKLAAALDKLTTSTEEPCKNCGGTGMDSTTVVTDPYPIDMPHPCGYCEGGTVQLTTSTEETQP